MALEVVFVEPDFEKRRNKNGFLPFLSVLVLVLESASVKRFSVSRMRDLFFYIEKYNTNIFLHNSLLDKQNFSFSSQLSVILSEGFFSYPKLFDNRRIFVLVVIAQ